MTVIIVGIVGAVMFILLFAIIFPRGRTLLRRVGETKPVPPDPADPEAPPQTGHRT